MSNNPRPPIPRPGKASRSASDVKWSSKCVFVMCGLPGRGKSHIGSKIVAFLTWRGLNCRLFNVGKARREELHDDPKQTAVFFDHSDQSATQRREQIAYKVLDQLLDWLEFEHGSVAVFDATNTTARRRMNVYKRVYRRSNKMPVVFVESICDDEQVLLSNYLVKCTYSPDYREMPLNEALADLKERIDNYSRVYQTVNNDQLSYIKLFNLATKVICNRVHGEIPILIATYLMSVHIRKRPIYLTRAGQPSTVMESYRRSWQGKGGSLAGVFAEPDPAVDDDQADSAQSSGLEDNAGSSLPPEHRRMFRSPPLSSRHLGHLEYADHPHLQFSESVSADDGFLPRNDSHLQLIDYGVDSSNDSSDQLLRPSVRTRFPGSEDSNPRFLESSDEEQPSLLQVVPAPEADPDADAVEIAPAGHQAAGGDAQDNGSGGHVNHTGAEDSDGSEQEADPVLAAVAAVSAARRYASPSRSVAEFSSSAWPRHRSNAGHARRPPTHLKSMIAPLSSAGETYAERLAVFIRAKSMLYQKRVEMDRRSAFRDPTRGGRKSGTANSLRRKVSEASVTHGSAGSAGSKAHPRGDSKGKSRERGGRSVENSADDGSAVLDDDYSYELTRSDSAHSDDEHDDDEADEEEEEDSVAAGGRFGTGSGTPVAKTINIERRSTLLASRPHQQEQRARRELARATGHMVSRDSSHIAETDPDSQERRSASAAGDGDGRSPYHRKASLDIAEFDSSSDEDEDPDDLPHRPGHRHEGSGSTATSVAGSTTDGAPAASSRRSSLTSSTSIATGLAGSAPRTPVASRPAPDEDGVLSRQRSTSPPIAGHPGHRSPPLGSPSSASIPATTPIGQARSSSGSSSDRLPVAIYCSTLPRAEQTVAHVPADVMLHSSLNSFNTGVFHGMSTEEILATEDGREQYRLWTKNPYTYRYPGGDSLRDVALSMESLVMDIERHTSPCLVVSHSNTLKVLYGYFLGGSVDPKYIHKLDIPPHTVIELIPALYGYVERRYQLNSDAQLQEHLESIRQEEEELERQLEKQQQLQELLRQHYPVTSQQDQDFFRSLQGLHASAGSADVIDRLQHQLRSLAGEQRKAEELLLKPSEAAGDSPALPRGTQFYE